MSNKTIQDLLAKLHAEIERTDIDADTRSQIRALDTDIHELLDPGTEQTDAGSVVETAQKLEADFAANHPVAERVLREIVEILGRMGV